VEADVRFEDFSFGSVRIDGAAYDHDVVIDRAKFSAARRKHPRSFVMLSDIHPCRWRKRSPGSAAGS
jgi:hypothetical protein